MSAHVTPSSDRCHCQRTDITPPSGSNTTAESRTPTVATPSSDNSTVGASLMSPISIDTPIWAVAPLAFVTSPQPYRGCAPTHGRARRSRSRLSGPVRRFTRKWWASGPDREYVRRPPLGSGSVAVSGLPTSIPPGCSHLHVGTWMPLRQMWVNRLALVRIHCSHSPERPGNINANATPTARSRRNRARWRQMPLFINLSSPAHGRWCWAGPITPTQPSRAESWKNASEWPSFMSTRNGYGYQGVIRLRTRSGFLSPPQTGR